MLIRTANEWDAHHIVECLHEAFAPYRERYTAGGFRDTVLDHTSVIDRLRAMTVFVAATDDGEIAGTVGCDDSGHVRGMAVRPQWQGKGVAEQLLHAAESRAQSMGCSRTTLDTTEPLERATRFYEQHGYERTGVVRDFFGMPLHEFAKTLQPAKAGGPAG